MATDVLHNLIWNPRPFSVTLIIVVMFTSHLLWQLNFCLPHLPCKLDFILLQFDNHICILGRLSWRLASVCGKNFWIFLFGIEDNLQILASKGQAKWLLLRWIGGVNLFSCSSSTDTKIWPSKTSERPGNQGSVISFFEHPLLYAMHVNAAFSTESFVGLYDWCAHCYWELQKNQCYTTTTTWFFLVKTLKIRNVFWGLWKHHTKLSCGKTMVFYNSQ